MNESFNAFAENLAVPRSFDRDTTTADNAAGADRDRSVALGDDADVATSDEALLDVYPTVATGQHANVASVDDRIADDDLLIASMSRERDVIVLERRREMRPGEDLSFRIRATAIRTGEAPIKVRVASDLSEEGIEKIIVTSIGS